MIVNSRAFQVVSLLLSWAVCWFTVPVWLGLHDTFNRLLVAWGAGCVLFLCVLVLFYAVECLTQPEGGAK